MKTLLQPGQQTRLGAGQIYASHANLGESKFLAPSLNPGNQLTAIDVQAGAQHPLIVKSLVWPDEVATRLFACALAAQPALRNCYVELHGELGAGKTTLVRHVLQALGVTGRIKSPTYAVVEQYALEGTPDDPRPLDIWHFDFYRFNDPREWEDAGLRDIFACQGLKFAEWPDKAATFAPLPDVVIRIDAQSDSVRQVQLVAQTPAGATVVARVAP